MDRSPRSHRLEIATFTAIAILFLDLTTFAAEPASSQEPTNLSVGVSAGPADPVAAAAGMRGGAALSGVLALTLPRNFSTRVELGTAAFDPSPRGYDGTLRATFVAANAAWGPRHGRWQPYLIGGLGLYHFTLRTGPVSHGASQGADNRMGLSAGGGVEFRMTRGVGFDVQTRYHRVGDLVAIVPFKGSFVSASFGLRWYPRH